MGGKPTAIPITEKDPPVSWAASQTGPRQQNEDDYGRADQDTEGYKWVHRGCLYLLADGMGGLDAGKEAAQTVVRQVIQEYTNSNGRSQDVAENLNQAIQNANQHLYKTSTRSGKRMGSTMVACVLKDGKATIAHAGDSRAYQLANGNVRRLTRDHLYATEVQGIKDDDEAKRSPEGHKITRALGKDPDLRVDINEVEYAAGDRFLLCSDGISEALSQEEIEACLCEKTPEKAVHALCSQAGPRLSDNATVVVVFASGNKIRRQKTMRRVINYAAAAVLFLAVTGGSYAGWLLFHKRGTQVGPIQQASDSGQKTVEDKKATQINQDKSPSEHQPDEEATKTKGAKLIRKPSPTELDHKKPSTRTPDPLHDHTDNSDKNEKTGIAIAGTNAKGPSAETNLKSVNNDHVGADAASQSNPANTSSNTVVSQPQQHSSISKVAVTNKTEQVADIFDGKTHDFLGTVEPGQEVPLESSHQSICWQYTSIGSAKPKICGVVVDNRFEIKATKDASKTN